MKKKQSRRKFIQNTAITAGSLMVSKGFFPAAAQSSFINEVPKERPFVGVQLDKAAFVNRNFSELFDEMQELAAINTVIYFFRDNDAKYGSSHHGGTVYRRGKVKLDNQGRDTIDLMQEAASERDMDIYMGGGEMFWGNCIGKFPDATLIDCFGEKFKFSCVNKPEWRKFQKAIHADLFEQHPYLKGFLFMHERTGPMITILKFDTWRGEFNPGCFCWHCIEKGEERGINADRAKKGFKKLIHLFRNRELELVRDGVMVGYWRILTEYPEILAWENLQWESFTDYRKEIVKSIREIKKEAVIGYHMQHEGFFGGIFSRANDTVERAAEFADWVKPCVYPGVSGKRYGILLNRARQTYLMDLDEETAHRAISAWFNRSPENAWGVIGGNPEEQRRFSPEWVESEVQRVKQVAGSLKVNAGLGIGIPGGETTEDEDYVRACTEACFKGNTDGIILSRHYSEIKPKFARSAGEVIRKHFNI